MANLTRAFAGFDGPREQPFARTPLLLPHAAGRLSAPLSDRRCVAVQCVANGPVSDSCTAPEDGLRGRESTRSNRSFTLTLQGASKPLKITDVRDLTSYRRFYKECLGQLYDIIFKQVKPKAWALMRKSAVTSGAARRQRRCRGAVYVCSTMCAALCVQRVTETRGDVEDSHGDGLDVPDKTGGGKSWLRKCTIANC